MTTPMIHRPDMRRFGPLLLLFLALAVAVAPSTRGATDRSSLRSLTGTLKSVDVKGRTVVVLTGVGHSIRAIRLRLSPGCRVEVSHRPASLTQLAPGQVARVGYEPAPRAAAGEAVGAAMAIEVSTPRGGVR